MNDRVDTSISNPEPDDEDSGPQEVKPKPATIAEKIVCLAQEHFELGRTQSGREYAMRNEDRAVVSVTEPTGLRKELRGLYYDAYGKVPTDRALAEAIGVLSCLAAKTEPDPDDPEVAAFEQVMANVEFVEQSQSGGDKEPDSQKILRLFHEHYTLGRDEGGREFALRKNGHVVTWLDGVGGIRKKLRGLFFETFDKVPGDQALSDAIGVLSCLAERVEETSVLHRRVAKPDDDKLEFWIDLGDHAEHVIHVSPEGWELLDGDADVPVIFKRSKITAPLPIPERDGDFEQLWRFVNVKGTARLLVRGWLVGGFVLEGVPRPILALLSEQGTAKTWAMRICLSLVDPTTSPIRRPPKDEISMMHALNASLGTGFDNLRTIPPWMSDALCRGVTGEFDVDRALYTDDDLRVIGIKGLIAFTGIDVGTLAGDLAERCVWATPDVISGSKRRSERQIQREWKKAYPQIFGGLLDLVVATLKALPDIQLDERPRMADFAEVLAAIDLATGTDGLCYYTATQASVAADIVDSDPVLAAITEYITTSRVLRAKELYEGIAQYKPEGYIYWPENSRTFGSKLRKYAPELRKTGWTVVEHKADPETKTAARWEFVPPEDPEAAAIADEVMSS